MDSQKVIASSDRFTQTSIDIERSKRNMNLCIFTGRLTRDPELRHTPNGIAVASFGIAINGRKEEDTIFLDLEAWAQGADAIHKWFKKGDLINVQTEMRIDKWTDKNTNEARSKPKFRVNRFEFPPINKGRDRAEESPAPAAPSEESLVDQTPAPVAAATPASAPARRPSAGKGRSARPPVEEPEGEDDDLPF